jgi:hypothetical protein
MVSSFRPNRPKRRTSTDYPERLKPLAPAQRASPLLGAPSLHIIRRSA